MDTVPYYEAPKEETPVKRGRGRPKGSKNKPKTDLPEPRKDYEEPRTE